MASDLSAVSTPAQLVPAIVAPRFRLPVGVALIALAACAVYYPAMKGAFLWDDDVLLTNNRLIHSPDGWSRIWSLSQPVDYWPVSNLSLWLEFRLWGMQPVGYHITNLLLHIAASLLVWAVLQRLKIPGAFLAGFLFAVHPVNVESVAWIAQRKTVMALMFFLLSIFWYLKADSQEPRRLRDRAVWPWYALSLLAFALGMLSKASIAPLPVVLLLICWWRRDRIAKRDIAWAAPFFVIAALLVLINMMFQASNGATRPVGFAERLAGAGGVLWFYLSKALLPVDLIFIYPQWNIQPSELRWWLPLAATIAVTAAVWWQRRTSWGRPLFFAWAYFGVMLVPVLGFADISFMNWSLVADHYQYAAILGPIALAAAGLSLWCARSRDGRQVAAAIVTSGLVVTLMFLSWSQSKMYLDAETHWQATIDKNPDCYVAHNNLGILLLNQSQFPQAIARFEDAVRLRPEFAEAQANLGTALFQIGQRDNGVSHAAEAARLNPNSAEAHSNLAGMLMAMGRTPEAIEHFQTAARLNPVDPVVQNNWGSALLQAGRPQDAIAHFQEALRLIPDAESPESLQNQTAAKAGQMKAIAASQQLAQQMPESAEAQFNLGNSLVKAGQAQEAIGHFEKALEMKPDFADAHLNLAGALFATGRKLEAIGHCREALKLRPDSVEAHYNLGAALLTNSDAREAIQQFQEAARLRPDYAEAWANLAIAHTEVGQINQGIQAGEKALELAQGQSKPALATQIDAWLKTQRATSGKGPPLPERP